MRVRLEGPCKRFVWFLIVDFTRHNPCRRYHHLTRGELTCDQLILIIALQLHHIIQQLVVVSDAIFALFTHYHVRIHEIALQTLLQRQKKSTADCMNL